MLEPATLIVIVLALTVIFAVHSSSAWELMAFGRPGARPTSEQGQGTVEYGLILASIAVVLILGMLFLGGKIEHLFENAPESPEFRPPAAMCDPSYSGACIPSPPPTLNCDDLRALGIRGEVRIVGSDPHGLDADGDGIACN